MLRVINDIAWLSQDMICQNKEKLWWNCNISTLFHYTEYFNRTRWFCLWFIDRIILSDDDFKIKSKCYSFIVVSPCLDSYGFQDDIILYSLCYILYFSKLSAGHVFFLPELQLVYRKLVPESTQGFYGGAEISPRGKIDVSEWFLFWWFHRR